MKDFGNIRWNGKQPVDDTCAERDKQCIGLTESGSPENVGTVVGNDIHTTELIVVSIAYQHLTYIKEQLTHLLHEHDEERALSSTTVAHDREELFPEVLALAL